MSKNQPDISLFELSLFHQATQLGSLRALSREMGLQPAHVSKVLKRLEAKMGIQLFRRTAHGLTATPEALVILDKVHTILQLGREISAPRGPLEPISRVWTFGSISFLSTYCLASALTKLAKSADFSESIPALKKTPALRFRMVEFTHNDLVAFGLQGAFELALHIEPLEWTKAWMSRSMGHLKWSLYGCHGHPLGTVTIAAKVPPYSFIVPTDWSGQGYALGEDFCPLSVNNRLRGHEASTAETALEVVRNSRQLSFVPEIVAEPWERAKLVQKIQVQDWPVVAKEIFLSFRSDLLPNSLLKELTPAIQERLS